MGRGKAPRSNPRRWAISGPQGNGEQRTTAVTGGLPSRQVTRTLGSQPQVRRRSNFAFTRQRPQVPTVDAARIPGPVERAANGQQANRKCHHEPPRIDGAVLWSHPATQGFVVVATHWVPGWHARGQGFKSPQLHPRSTALSAVDHPRIPALAQQIRSNRQCAADAVVKRGSHAGHHRRGRLPVDPPHRTATGAAVAAAAGMSYQLVDNPSRDAAILQPGREGVAQVMLAPQIEVAKVGPRRLDGGLIDPPQIGGGQRGLERRGGCRCCPRGRGGPNPQDGSPRPAGGPSPAGPGRTWAPLGRWPGSWVRP